jgi:hypothetical protein
MMCVHSISKFLLLVVQVVKLLREAYDRVKLLLKKVCPLDFIFFFFGSLFLENEKSATLGC